MIESRARQGTKDVEEKTYTNEETIVDSIRERTWVIDEQQWQKSLVWQTKKRGKIADLKKVEKNQKVLSAQTIGERRSYGGND